MESPILLLVGRLRAARGRTALAGFLAAWLAVLSPAHSATLSDPSVDSYNVHVGTQTFAGLYQFTTNSLLVETAEAIRALGSDVIKFYLGPDYARQYRVPLPANVTDLLSLARDEPACRSILDLPFRHFVMWAYPFGNAWPFDGYSPAERADDYREIYDLTRYLLTNYNLSGKTFYLGHWEGDWYLLPNYNTQTNPTPVAIQGMIDWLNNRQQAIDDARRDTPATNVAVFGYTEVNRVQDALSGNPNLNHRAINRVVPYVTNLDCLSYSSYDVQDADAAHLNATLDYLKANLPPNKAGSVPGQRIWIGEYGWGGLPTAAQEPKTRSYLQRLLGWPAGPPRFMLFWEIYNNETNQNFCLIDPSNHQTASYLLHQRLINRARLEVARFQERQGRLPQDAEFGPLLTPLLNQPLPPPAALTVANLTARPFTNSAILAVGTLTQGLYGDDRANVWLFWGRQDGGTVRSAWESSQWLGVNTNFNPATFTCLLTNAGGPGDLYFRFYATNAVGEAWAPASAQVLDPASFGWRMKLTFTGYDRGEALANFPALANFGPNLPGFAYRQLATPAGADLRFTEAAGLLLLPHEIDEWNSNGGSSVWVQVPLLATTNDSIWAYWGNPAATNPPAYSTNGAVWSPGYDLVWHLKESAFPYADSAGHHPALSGVAPASAPGLVGKGCAFDGSSQFLDAGAIDLGAAFTLSAAVRLDPTATDIQTLWANKSGGWNANGFALYVDSYQTSDRALLLETGDGTAGLTAATAANAVSAGQWHRLTASVDLIDGTARLFVDGVDLTQASAIQPGLANQASLFLGRFAAPGFYLKGTLDEVRLEAGTRSANWVWATGMTAASNALFATWSVVNPRPVLSVGSTGASAELTWRADAGALTLYTTADLATGTWTPAADPPTLANGRWHVDLTPTASHRFYRLQYR